MEQLVGCTCVVCGQRISSILEGHFCSACGNAVHHDCNKPADAPADPERCPGCGGQRSNPAAKRVQFERAQQPGAIPRGGYPVGKVCPACGHARFERVDPDRWITFGFDRVCLACGTRYTPPTPVWAAVVMLLAGLLLLAVALVGGYFSLRAIDLVALGLMGLLGVLGALALRHGIRSLIRPGKV
jgi:hypothetical protein